MNNISMTRGTKCEKFQQLKKKTLKNRQKYCENQFLGPSAGFFLSDSSKIGGIPHILGPLT